MTWYKTGTATVTNGSPTVTLAGANAELNIFPDDGFVGPDGRLYAVLAVANATTLTLSTNYSGPTTAGASYLAVPVADHVQLRDLLIEVNTLVGDYQTIANEAGAGRFPNGSAASPGVKGINNAGTGLVWTGTSLSVSVNGTIVATFFASGSSVITFTDGTVTSPGIRFADDPNTGIYRPNADTLGVSTGGTETVRVTNTGVTIANFGGIFNPYCPLSIRSAANSQTMALTVGANPVGNGLDFYAELDTFPTTFKAIIGVSASVTGRRIGDILISPRHGSAVRFFTSPPDIAPIEAMMISSDGRVLMGASQGQSSSRFHVRAPSTGGFTSVARFDSVNASGTDNHGLVILADETSNIVDFQSTGSSAGSFTFSSGPTKRLELTSGGLLLAVDGTINNPPYSFTNYPSTGFYMTGVGSLASTMGGTIAWVTSQATHFYPGNDNVSSLGVGNSRPSVIYAATGTINTSDQNEKTPLRSLTSAELTASRRIAKIIGIFQWLDAVAKKGEYNARHHVGVIAQDVWGIMADEGLIAPLVEGETPSTKYGFLCYDEWEEETEPVMEEITIPAVLDDEGEVVEPEHTEEQPTGETRVTMEAGKRFGIRPDQLAMFLIAAQEARLTALEESL